MKVRKANFSDKKDLFNWRNDETSIKMSINSSPISEITHNKWFDSALKDKFIILLIAEENKDKISVVRFDIHEDKKVAEISINLNPQERGRGKSVSVLCKCIMYFIKYNKYEIKTIIARIKKQNNPSKLSFLKSGFEFSHIDDDIEIYQYSL